MAWSTVEIIKAPVPYDEPHDGYDRSPGKGVGHVLRAAAARCPDDGDEGDGTELLVYEAPR